MTTITDELLTRQEVAKLFRVTEQTIVLWEKRKMFPALRLGTRVRYRRQDIEAFISLGQQSGQQ